VIAGFESVRLAEQLADEHLVGPGGINPATTAQKYVVERRPPALGNRDETASRRLGHPRHVERHVRHDTGGHGVNAGKGRHPLFESRRSSLERGKHVRKTRLVVIGRSRPLQRVEIREVRHEHRHAGCHHCRDCRRLCSHGPEIAQQLAIEHP
jgi:hypothetical protein